MKKRLGTNKIRKMDRKIVSIAGLIGILIGISFFGAVGAIENDTISQVNDSVNISEAAVSNISNIVPRQIDDDGPIVNIPDKEFMPEYRESVIVYFKQMPPSIKGFARKYGIAPMFVKQDIKMVGFETMSEGKSGETSQRTLDIVSTLSNDPLVEKAFLDEYRFINSKKNYSTGPVIQGPEYFDNLGISYNHSIVRVTFFRTPPSLEGFASKYGVKLMELTEGDKFFMSAGFETNNISDFINKISTDPYVEFVTLVDTEPSLAIISDNNSLDNNNLDNNSLEVNDTYKSPGFDLSTILLLIFVIFMVRRR